MMSRCMHRFWPILLALSAACSTGEPSAELVVGLRTDLAAPFEFDTVELFLTPLEGLAPGGRRQLASSTDGYLPGQRLAELDGLSPGDYRLDLILANGGGSRLVAERPALLTLTDSKAVTIPLDRSCLNVACPPTDDPNTPEDESTRIACLGGQCVSPRCTVETPEHCGNLTFCVEDTDCSPRATCAAGECALGTCWAKPRIDADERCDETAWCHPDLGCLGRGEEGVDLCQNGVVDDGELDVDCGGICPPCSIESTVAGPTANHCVDDIENEGEQGVDCGGECAHCKPVSQSCIAGGDIPTYECHALAAIWKGWHLDENTYYSDWFDGSSPCSWTTLTCSGGHISAIQIDDVFTFGELEIYGEIPLALFNLRHLEQLDLEGTKVFGTLPPEIGKLTKLRVLDLVGNGLHGTLPTELGQLQSAEVIRLGDAFTGTLPPSLGALSNLQVLDTGRMRSGISGTIPPEYGDLAALETLILRDAALEGSIPDSLARLSNLNTLLLNNNRLTGAVPEGLRSIPTLARFESYSNGCLWTEDCGTMKSWLDARDTNWSQPANVASCTIPAGTCD